MPSKIYSLVTPPFLDEKGNKVYSVNMPVRDVFSKVYSLELQMVSPFTSTIRDFTFTLPAYSRVNGYLHEEPAVEAERILEVKAHVDSPVISTFTRQGREATVADLDLSTLSEKSSSYVANIVSTSQGLKVSNNLSLIAENIRSARRTDNIAEVIQTLQSVNERIFDCTVSQLIETDSNTRESFGNIIGLDTVDRPNTFETDISENQRVEILSDFDMSIVLDEQTKRAAKINIGNTIVEQVESLLVERTILSSIITDWLFDIISPTLSVRIDEFDIFEGGGYETWLHQFETAILPSREIVMNSVDTLIESIEKLNSYSMTLVSSFESDLLGPEFKAHIDTLSLAERVYLCEVVLSKMDESVLPLSTYGADVHYLDISMKLKPEYGIFINEFDDMLIQHSVVESTLLQTDFSTKSQIREMGITDSFEALKFYPVFEIYRPSEYEKSARTRVAQVVEIGRTDDFERFEFVEPSEMTIDNNVFSTRNRVEHEAESGEFELSDRRLHEVQGSTVVSIDSSFIKYSEFDAQIVDFGLSDKVHKEFYTHLEEFIGADGDIYLAEMAKFDIAAGREQTFYASAYDTVKASAVTDEFYTELYTLDLSTRVDSVFIGATIQDTQTASKTNLEFYTMIDEFYKFSFGSEPMDAYVGVSELFNRHGNNHLMNLSVTEYSSINHTFETEIPEYELFNRTDEFVTYTDDLVSSSRKNSFDTMLYGMDEFSREDEVETMLYETVSAIRDDVSLAFAPYETHQFGRTVKVMETPDEIEISERVSTRFTSVQETVTFIRDIVYNSIVDEPILVDPPPNEEYTWLWHSRPSWWSGWNYRKTK